MASLNLLNIAQNMIVTAGLLAGTIYCGHLVIEGTLKVKTILVIVRKTLNQFIGIDRRLGKPIVLTMCFTAM